MDLIPKKPDTERKEKNWKKKFKEECELEVLFRDEPIYLLHDIHTYAEK